MPWRAARAPAGRAPFTNSSALSVVHACSSRSDCGAPPPLGTTCAAGVDDSAARARARCTRPTTKLDTVDAAASAPRPERTRRKASCSQPPGPARARAHLYTALEVGEKTPTGKLGELPMGSRARASQNSSTSAVADAACASAHSTAATVAPRSTHMSTTPATRRPARARGAGPEAALGATRVRACSSATKSSARAASLPPAAARVAR